ncbi:hypothetical protein TR13x_01830 [Caloranaerobacter sp. TR13]|uniref:hypothetical protein n=1 Tax=Caloranaerobacter sp. TR13 TaxID=1302151 RepID=UPI0006D456F0|nr:hypothetical protein [Caloranaerobacter sp. TR13]KPU28103.1 hypothetical protein TR13x_01830 [Caloranaerobacter sp. TR13]
MYQNIKNNVITIISIFVSLSIGIYIGYIIDLQSSVLETDEKLINLIEKQINYLESENELLRKQVSLERNVNSVIKKTLSSIRLKKLINVHIILISYEKEFNYDELIKHIKELGVNNIDVISMENILIRGINESDNLEEIYKDKDILKIYFKKGLKDSFGNMLYKSKYNKSKEITINNKKNYKDFIVFIKNSESNRISFLEKTVEEVIIKLCKERNLPLIIIEKENQDSSKQVFKKK